jgi:hypothetical protein
LLHLHHYLQRCTWTPCTYRQVEVLNTSCRVAVPFPTIPSSAHFAARMQRPWPIGFSRISCAVGAHSARLSQIMALHLWRHSLILRNSTTFIISTFPVIIRRPILWSVHTLMFARLSSKPLIGTCQSGTLLCIPFLGLIVSLYAIVWGAHLTLLPQEHIVKK